MKKQLLIIAVTTFLNAGYSFATTIESILENTWLGRCKQYTDLFQNGYAIIDYELSGIDFNSYDNTFTGRMKSNINIDYKDYVSVMNVSGTYNPTNHEIWIYPGSNIREDYLPQGLYWVYLKIRATIFYDANRNGYHLIQGHTVNNNGYNESDIEFSDYPYFI